MRKFTIIGILLSIFMVLGGIFFHMTTAHWTSYLVVIIGIVLFNILLWDHQDELEIKRELDEYADMRRNTQARLDEIKSQWGKER